MNNKHITRLLFILPFFMLLSCSKEDISEYTPNETDHSDEISFKISFAPQSRVSTDTAFKASWEDGDQIGIFASVYRSGENDTLSSKASENYFNNIRLTYTKATGLWKTGSGIKLRWPANGDALNFYAYYPYHVSATDPTSILFNVAVPHNDSLYNTNCLLYSKNDNEGKGCKAGNPVLLHFTHALALVQMQINHPLQDGDSLSAILYGAKYGTILNLGAANGSEVITNNNIANIRMYRMEQQGDPNYNNLFTFRIMVPAQTLQTGSKMFGIIWNNRLLIDAPIQNEKVLEAGHVYCLKRSLPAAI
ncbi:fimbrillin family protein [Odoribacter sp. OttesenSCG-928-J03]|nr:fimbrillin family protein [Odoribacter sp. OttesenSCG-928-J03]MDL2283099.1 fimbrillin family protein [Odoribacter sp. OttesenSCG-928-G04]MDL2331137.1 fimbrillin family protein [Odoribacter sp. OttesenSCG-928-A06]